MTPALEPNVLPNPLLKWAGGKRWFVPTLAPIWKKFSGSRIVEPFCGGLAVSLGLAPRYSLLNDLNPHPVNLYQWIQRGLTENIEMKNDESFYYATRERFNALVSAHQADGVESALLFYYLNRSGYNGLCRFNSKGHFNVPFGKYRSIRYLTDFEVYRQAFSNWRFITGDFEEIQLESDDFVYADPPYDVEFTRYAAQDFGWDDQVRLAHWLTYHSGPVLLSNQATPRILALYEKLGYTTQLLSAPRMISCNGNRDRATEVLATRNI
ncbi:MAG TPA: Dam family site-specific DNA-(adenine-N6)-methyltransferase [Myxococcales bacterium]|nr:Dam family site-specific DNA-(adenine-N6)-methyltransferase [Myxococcales bacterium]